MIHKKIAILLITITFLANFSATNYFEICKGTPPPRFYVDDDAEESWYLDLEHFSSIQTAINNADPYDRILVYAGTYTENIVIDKTGISLFGEDKNLVTVSGTGTGSVINITSDKVDVSSFTITNSGSNSTDALIKISASKTIITDNILTSGGNGIFIENCSETTIYYNDISDCDKKGIHIENSIDNKIEQVDISDIEKSGIFLKNVSGDTSVTYTNINTCELNGLFCYRCSDIDISNCNIKNNEKHGIHFNNTCNDNTLSNNNISENDKNGIYLNDHSMRNTITQNDLFKNSLDAAGYYTYAGIRVENSSSNIIGNNNVINNYFYGVMIVGENNIIHNSTINYNNQHGVFLFGDNNNEVNDNDIVNNSKSGIRLHNSTDDKFTRNEISDNNHGIYLNYYSTRNEIWNNYFHDNTVNAFDISPNNNIWNKTSYTGNNIVNGNQKNVAGNYWDDFDETSEGATDTNRDGIIEGDKPIDISSYDYLPISDIINPTIQNTDVSPSSQTIGGYTYISADITDNTEIKDVRLVLTCPDESTSNFSIFQNLTDTTYYCNKQFSQVGNYSFKIKAKDPMNWETSNSYTFEINEGTAPSVTDNSATSAEAGSIFVFNATVTDDSDSADEITVKVIWSHKEHGGNNTMTNINGNYFRYTGELDNKLGDLSYYFYTADSWGNKKSTDSKTIEITDTTQPTITINKHEYESDGFIHTYEICTTITDNSQITGSYIEYWINSGEHNSAEMDKSGNSYEKTIYLENADDKVYCIINATDSAGNIIDTKKPYANADGPYTGVISHPLTFNASKSFDLDGSITEYLWDFGDGTTKTGESVEHTYLTNDNYKVTLKITDNDELTDTDTTTATIGQADKTFVSQSTITKIENDYEIEIDEAFYCYDIDGDNVEDRFYDPNDVIKTVQDEAIDISNEIHFLLSPKEKEDIFLWNTESDEVYTVDKIEKEGEIEESDQKAFVNITIEKNIGWIYIETKDEYPNADVDIYKNETEIENNMFWRSSSKIFILDDPETLYQLIYDKDTISTEVLKWVKFTPGPDSNVSVNDPTITIEYNTAVTIKEVEFYDYKNDYAKDIFDDLKTTNNVVFTYTPENLVAGDYDIVIEAEDSTGNTLRNWSLYHYTGKIEKPEESSFNIFSVIPFIGIICGIAIAFYLLFRYKKIALESFIYFKNKKIIPFFKPIVFGPVRLNIDESNIKKAEFYVNGKLHDTITQPPYSFDFDKTGLMKPRIEAKIYDEAGKESSTGEMTFYVFNNRFFK